MRRRRALRRTSTVVLARSAAAEALAAYQQNFAKSSVHGSRHAQHVDRIHRVGIHDGLRLRIKIVEIGLD